MFRIKICGITRVDDAQTAAAAGADAIGLNFYERSPRFVRLDIARQIAAQLPAQVLPIGVFVSAPLDQIRRVASEVPLRAIQLHGDEPPEFVAALSDWPVIRALRCQDSLAAAGEYLRECQTIGCLPAAVLIDAHSPTQYGGTGTVANWGLVARERDQLCGLPLILAGGLGPANVAQAIASVAPAGVDTASGVESAPGVKSAEMVVAFVARARGAFEALARRAKGGDGLSGATFSAP